MKINVTAEIVKITPDMASDWLQERWGEQRKVRAAHVSRLASDMIAGRFKISPDAILRIKGKIANGQHRMEAIVESGKPQYFLVMESNDEELYKVIDSGLKRTASDGLIGLPYAKGIPSIARWVQSYEKLTLFASARNASEAAGALNGFITQSELIDYCISNQEILSEAASFVCGLYEKTKLLPGSIGGALYVIGKNHGKGAEVIEFLKNVYIDGGNNAAGDLRNRLISNRGSKSKISSGYIFGICIKAFSSFCKGARPGVLKWAKDEKFPTI